MTTENKIIISDCSKEFKIARGGEQQALSNINLEVAEGEFLCLLGASGCGKTTLLNLIAGFEHPSAGSVTIDGRKVAAPDPRYVTIFQNYGLFPWRDVLGNVEYGLEVKGVNTKERKKIAQEYIEMVGLEKFLHSHPGELSGGMQQRVAIARALAVNPEIIFMDEPFGALDAITRFRMQEEITSIWLERKPTIVFVTHDIEEAVYLADRIIIMSPHPGRISSEISVRMGRPRDRTSPDFVEIRDKVYTALALKNEELLDYYI